MKCFKRKKNSSNDEVLQKREREKEVTEKEGKCEEKRKMRRNRNGVKKEGIKENQYENMKEENEENKDIDLRMACAREKRKKDRPDLRKIDGKRKQ